MKLLILGATGATGLQLIDQAVSSGHVVTTYVRNPGKLAHWGKRITIVEGQLLDEYKLLQVVKGQDAVLVTLGYKKLKDKSRFIRKTIDTVIIGMRRFGVQKLVYESAYGIGGKHSVTNPFIRFMLQALGIAHPFIDHFETEKLIRQSNVNWTIVRPGNLTNGPLTGKYRAQEQMKGFPSISRADVAHFMLQSLTEKKWANKAVDLGN
jgi:uncharacterized protein YbjT (DUF2867 family)